MSSSLLSHPVFATSSSDEDRSEALFEVVLGKRVELPNISSRSGDIANELSIELAIYTRQHGLGKTLTEILFSIPTQDDPENQRRPDVAFLSLARWPRDQRAPDTDPWPAVPNLAVEVLSPHDRIRDLDNKIDEYFEAGVELVWVVDPNKERVLVYTSPESWKIVKKHETLEAGMVVPGFELPLSQLFGR
jgi:Uma2 family endonuclease